MLNVQMRAEIAEQESRICTWLSEARQPVRRAGALQLEEVAEATTAFFLNAKSLLEDAQLLISHGRVACAAALAVLGIEELAKVPLMVDTFGSALTRSDDEPWRSYWKSGAAHVRKQALILDYGKRLRERLQGSLMGEQLYRFYPPDDLVDKLDWFKQTNFYVDVRADGVHSPAASQGVIDALDYLLAFGQERTDSFGSWHVSVERGSGFLRRITGLERTRTRPSSYRVFEIEADILYEASSLSASEVPDYDLFLGFVRDYRSYASEKRIKEAVLSVGRLLRRRADLSERLPTYGRRATGAFKLIMMLTREASPFGAGYRKDLREALLPPQVPSSED